jgi:hypothetical protein
MPIRKTGSLPEPIDRQVNEIIRAVNVIEEQIAKLSQGLRGQNAKTSTMEGIVAAQGDEIRAILPITRDKLVDDVLSGLIVESGSNANGRYVRWGNGLQICFVRGVAFTGDGTSDEKMGSWTHPAAFASSPAIVGRNAHSQSSPPYWYIDVNPGVDAALTSVSWSAYRRTGSWTSGADYYLHYIAIGRWK